MTAPQHVLSLARKALHMTSPDCLIATTAHQQIVREINPGDVNTWADLTICYPGHELVYRLRDQAGALLYVGMTWNPKERWKYHRKTKAWWSAVRSVEVECHDSDALAREEEWRAIKTEAPLHNIHGAVR